MKDASRVLYKIGRIFNIIEIVCAALFFFTSIAMLTDTAKFVQVLNESNPATAYTAETVTALAVTLLIAMIFAVALSIITLVLSKKAIDNLQSGNNNNGIHIAMLVLGIFSSLFHFLGGIFALVANGQNTTAPQQTTEQQ